MSITLKAKALAEARKSLNEDLQPLLQSLKTTDVPLEDRWAAYVTLVKGNVLTSIETYGDGFVETLNPKYTLYDHFYCERHQTMSYPDMLEQVEDEWFNGEKPTDEAIREWKEEVLASGHAGFKHDW